MIPQNTRSSLSARRLRDLFCTSLLCGRDRLNYSVGRAAFLTGFLGREILYGQNCSRVFSPQTCGTRPLAYPDSFGQDWPGHFRGDGIHTTSPLAIPEEVGQVPKGPKKINMDPGQGRQD